MTVLSLLTFLELEICLISYRILTSVFNVALVYLVRMAYLLKLELM